MAEPLRRTIHRIGPTRVPRSRRRVIGCRPSAHAERVHRVLFAHANAPRAGQGCTFSTSCRAADGRPCDRRATGRWSAPPVRTRRLISPLPCPTSPWHAAHTSVRSRPSLFLGRIHIVRQPGIAGALTAIPIPTEQGETALRRCQRVSFSEHRTILPFFAAACGIGPEAPTEVPPVQIPAYKPGAMRAKRSGSTV